MFKFILILILLKLLAFGNILQDAIDNAPKYSTLKLPKGTYKGNIIINKPLTIIGKDSNVVIKGENINSIITINSDNVTLQNLIIKNSGSRIENKDSAIKIIKGNNITIDSCTITKSLYGIDAGMMKNALIQNNIIRSKEEKIPQRGDAMKFYYLTDSQIKNNLIDQSKDVTFSYSNNNTITNNHIKNSRFALHFENSHNNTITNNMIEFNSAGLLFTGAKNTLVQNNTIKSSQGKAGIGVLIKGVSEFKFLDNTISYNSKAFYIDAKHNETKIKRYIQNNEITYNMEALHFHGAIKYNQITDNTFIGNIDDVVKSVRGNTTSKNIVHNNYWDHYAGFDKNKDNIGDHSYKMYQYADRIWHHNNKIKFFYATPIISIINFILSVAPFIEPVLLLEDTAPCMYIKT